MKLFTGKYCMPCKMLKQWLNENNIKIEEVSVDDNMKEVERLNIKQTPTLVLDDETIIAGKDNIEEYFDGEENE